MNPSHLIPHLSANDSFENFQAKFSKWISLDLLIDENEIKDLLENLQPVFLLTMQNLSLQEPFILDQNKFLNVYCSYISDLKKGTIPKFNDFKKFFYLFLSASLEDLYIRELASEKKALVINTPVIEVKPICLAVSEVDQLVRVMPLNPNGILWGLRFSFPQMLQKGGSHDIMQIDFQKHPNGKLFKIIRKWVREKTKATPFIIQKEKVNSPIRLGKECFKWINQHPQFTKIISIEKKST